MIVDVLLIILLAVFFVLVAVGLWAWGCMFAGMVRRLFTDEKDSLS